MIKLIMSQWKNPPTQKKKKKKKFDNSHLTVVFRIYGFVPSAA